MLWRPAYVALGSNLADPRRQLESAFNALAAIAGARLMARSSPWRSTPMGPQDQPDFVNAVAGLVTTLAPRELLDALQAIERRMGRIEPEVRWGARLIDLDLLLVGDLEIDEPSLRLPHAGLHQRNFVLYPLAEIAPELWVPGHGRVQSLLQRIPDEGVLRLAARGSGDD
jgi:2-amino-4-hydroxy-6-hydroxymethyldihydropteridine diphosphokinase